MKKKYVKPILLSEYFSPEEYCSSCGENGKTYNFECNAGSIYSSYNVYFDNGTPNDTSDDVAWTTSDDDWVNRMAEGRDFDKSYHPCNVKHAASSQDDFVTGYMYQRTTGWEGWFAKSGQDTGNPINVIIWTDGGTNTHCTTNLNIDSWEVLKS